MKESKLANKIILEYEQKKRWEEKAKRLEKFKKKKEYKNGKVKD